MIRCLILCWTKLTNDINIIFKLSCISEAKNWWVATKGLPRQFVEIFDYKVLFKCLVTAVIGSTQVTVVGSKRPAHETKLKADVISVIEMIVPN